MKTSSLFILIIYTFLDGAWLKTTALTVHGRRNTRSAVTVSTVVKVRVAAEIINSFLIFKLVNLSIRHFVVVATANLALRVEKAVRQYVSVLFRARPKDNI